MRDIAIPIPTHIDCVNVERAINRAITQRGLTTTLRTSLKKSPGSTHWHIKKGGERGTLEITLWPAQHRAWFTIHDNRSADWIAVEVPRLKKLIQNTLLEKRKDQQSAPPAAATNRVNS